MTATRQRWWAFLCAAIAVLCGAAAPAGAAPATDPAQPGLTARNLLLIINRNEPAGQRLAEHYARARGVPAGRILALDLPTTDELTQEGYDARVVPLVRKRLEAPDAAEIRCLVTFFGVPLRVGPRINTPEESAEYRDVAAQFERAKADALKAVTELEAYAIASSKEFKPRKGSEPWELAARSAEVMPLVLDALFKEPDENVRADRFVKLMAPIEALSGPAETHMRLRQPGMERLAARVATPEQLANAREQSEAVQKELSRLGPIAARDPAARAEMRRLFAEKLGLVRTLGVLQLHHQRLETKETVAAFDSELACLFWPDERPRHRWHESPLQYRLRTDPAERFPRPTTTPTTRPAAPRTLMVMRIDAPSEALARGVIDTSIRVEAAGLAGGIALDARGKPATDSYGAFDETIRRLATTLRAKESLTLTFDDQERIFPPHSVDNVALYCGWYSVRSYVPGMKFVPGAVGYHIASFELVSLRNPNEKGWVRGLMADGVVATLGAVAEPYLHAFPNPSEFFPLLMTGELTLAEVYWATNPLVSWMNCCIGDPLYRPYAAKPALTRDDLPPALAIILKQMRPGEASSRGTSQ